MAAVVHGCGNSSPRQHHANNISSSSPANSHHKHQPNVPVYSTTMPKYTRSSAPQLATMSTNHRHLYGGKTPNSGHQYNLPLPQVTYLPLGMGSLSTPQHSFATTQRPVSGTPLTEPCRNYWGQPGIYRVGRHHNKRKSAVELLAETKPFYIKSESVMERLHQSNYRSANLSIGSKRGRNSLDSRDEVRRYKPSSYGDMSDVVDADHRFAASPPMPHLHQNRSTSHVHHHHHRIHHTHVPRHNVSVSNNQLQSKVRPFLNDGDTSNDRTLSDVRNYINDLPQRKLCKEVAFPLDDDVSIRLPPPAFLSPQSYENAYSYGVKNCSADEPLVLTENYRPISPPAEYAAESSNTNAEQRSRYNYQRSYSHSHEVAAKNSKFNINSHKSLPDLHSQISRHSPHSEILSCCSRGNRSIKSAGESSLNRDSGGSSGHYTHRSEPCYRQQRENSDREMYASQNCNNTILPMDYRRDSGSSTQHSANSYCGGYTSSTYMRNTDCTECRCKNEVRFDCENYLLNFTTPEVPEAFQDDYTPTSPSVSNIKYKMDTSQYSNLSSTQQFNNAKTCGGEKSPKTAMVQSPGSAPSVEDISPPPIQFKRQRCIRFKNRNRISLPSSVQPSGMETEDREPFHSGEPCAFFFPKCFASNLYQSQDKPFCEAAASESASNFNEMHQACGFDGGIQDLEKFFDRLGLNDDRFHEIYSTPRRRRSAETDSEDSSTVFFSDVSTVDSMRLPDSTESQTQTSQPYRPSEPPSIVERNARIIKWLCNCRKLQFA